MKKLMVMLGAVAMAACVQAASVTWATTNNGLMDPTGNYAGGEGYITMYMFSIDSATYTDLTKGGEAGVAAAVWGKYGSKLATATDSYVDDGMGQIMITDTKAYGVGDTAYSAIILTYNKGDGVTHYVANAGAYAFDADIDITVAEMDTFIGGEAGSMSTATGWTAVPEPTSGLLLLLGVAGLALKRKRA